MADLKIRPATLDDRAKLEELISICYADVYPGWYDEDILVDALPVMLKIDEKLLSSGRYLVAEKAGAFAGCGGWSMAQPGTGAQSEGLGHIRHFATHPDFMRQGVGGAILETCVRHAREAGVKRLQCFSSLAAEDFYARNGFEKLQDANVMLDGRVSFPAILMERTLS